MGKNSDIQWTDHTFNPWMGCTKVSDGCKHCYAETYTRRFKKAEWGPQAQRVKTSAAYWKQPLKWNNETWRECLDCGKRGKVGADEPFYMCSCDPIKRNTVPTRLLYPYPTGNQDRSDLFLLQDAKDFMEMKNER